MAPKVGSLFTGIGGLDYGLEAAGFEIAFNVEIEPSCQGILKRHFPNVPTYTDVKEITRERLVKDLGEDGAAIDVLVGGWPCQDLSVAGKRAGLAGSRSGLFHEYMRLVDELSPQWILAENVPGLLSAGCKPKCPGGCVPTHGGAMGTVIGALADRGYGFAWRVLDAQYVGLAQRRKRVFIVGHLGEPWSAAAEVLLEPTCLQGDPPTRGKKGKVAASGSARRTRGDHRNGRGEGVVAALSANGVGVAGPDDNQAQAGHIIAPEVSGTLGGGSGRRGWSDDLDRAGAFIATEPEVRTHPEVARTLLAMEHGLRYDFESESLAFSVYPTKGAQDLAATEVQVAPALTATAEAAKTDRGTRIVQAIAENQRAEVRTMDIASQLNTGGGKPGQGYAAVHEDGLVRRLTPTECERLQGFPDGWTATDAGGNTVSDSVRYRMLGNAVATNCSEWIGKRLAKTIERLEGEA